MELTRLPLLMLLILLCFILIVPAQDTNGDVFNLVSSYSSSSFPNLWSTELSKMLNATKPTLPELINSTNIKYNSNNTENVTVMIISGDTVQAVLDLGTNSTRPIGIKCCNQEGNANIKTCGNGTDCSTVCNPNAGKNNTNPCLNIVLKEEVWNSTNPSPFCNKNMEQGFCNNPNYTIPPYLLTCRNNCTNLVIAIIDGVRKHCMCDQTCNTYKDCCDDFNLECGVATPSILGRIGQEKPLLPLHLPIPKPTSLSSLSCANKCGSHVLWNRKFCFCDQDCHRFKDCCADYDHHCTLTASNSILPKESQSISKTRNRRDESYAARSCPACSTTIMDLSWCMSTVHDKHDIPDHPICCFHPSVIAKDPEGMKCRCCKQGFAEHCNTNKPCCYNPKKDGCNQ